MEGGLQIDGGVYIPSTANKKDLTIPARRRRRRDHVAFAERVRRARRRRCCEARFSAAALSRASSSAAARAFASALDAVPSESVDVRTGTAPKLP